MSSRVIVKNLPKHLTQDRFREHFAAKGEVTDAKIMFTSSGKNRHFGFIGYRTEKEARTAVAYFNNTFVDTSKISVELAIPVGDSSLPRAWSRYTRSHAAQVNQPPVKSSTDQQSEYHVAATNPKDVHLQQFLEIMKPRAQIKSWQNDDITGEQNSQSMKVVKLQVANKKTGGDGMTVEKMHVTFADEDDDEYQDLNAPLTEVISSFHTRSPDKITDVASANGTNMVTPCDPPTPPPEKSMEEKAIESLQETGRIFVRNLSYHCTEKELEKFFGKFGPLAEIHIPIDSENKKSKGFAYVLYVLPEHAVKAFLELDGKIFQGRVVHLLPAKEKKVVAGETPDDTSYKKKKKSDDKARAAEDYNWNSLFMSADAVAEAMASELELEKRDILDRDADNMAVRLALAETHVIQKTVQYLKEAGVDIKAFQQKPIERSETILLVKNISFSTTEADLLDLFEKYGDIVKIILPPTKTIGLVEYASGNDAKVALKALAYKNFKGRPLLLEKAPSGSMSLGDAIAAISPSKAKDASVPLEKPLHVQVAVGSTDEEITQPSGSTLYVKNLSFSTNQDDFRNVFAPLEGFRSAIIRTKKDVRNPGILLSMGFGLVEFDSVHHAKSAMKILQGTLLDGHALQINFSGRSVGATGETSSRKPAAKPPGTKLLVRNIPFEATKKDIFDLFCSFGTVKRVRLPMKLDNRSHRGFAFVELSSKEEAQSAMNALCSSHLYGRRLVIEYGEEASATVDEMRTKTKRQYSTMGIITAKKTRVALPETSAGEMREDE